MKNTSDFSRMCRYFLSTALMGAVFCFFSGNTFAADDWDWVRSFGKPGTAILSMTEFDGDLYVMSSGEKHTSNIVICPSPSYCPPPPEIDSPAIWKQVAPGCDQWFNVTPYAFAGPAVVLPAAMISFKDKLYIGWQDRIYRMNPEAGGKWEKVRFFESANMYDMAEFGNYLYVAFANRVLRTSGGKITPISAWEQVFSVPSPYRVESLKVFNGYLYAGIGKGDDNGIEIYRTANGKNWDTFKLVYPPDVFEYFPGHVYAMEAFKGYLYIGQYQGRGVWRTDGAKSSWEEISDIIEPVPIPLNEIEASVYRLEKHNGKLYLGVKAKDTVNGVGLLYSSKNGQSWSKVGGATTVYGPTTLPVYPAWYLTGISSMLSFNNKLYAGTDILDTNAVDYVPIFYNPPAILCVAQWVGPVIKFVTKDILYAKDTLTECLTNGSCDEATLSLGDAYDPTLAPRGYPWGFAPVVDLSNMFAEMEMPADKEEIRQLILENLLMVNTEMTQAMLPLYEYTPGDDILTGIGTFDPAVISESIAHLDDALKLTKKTKVLSALLQGKGPRMVPKPFRSEE
jgi:hypothetical protein